MHGLAAGSDDPTKKKKKVTWASDDSLTKMHYFEMDESERGKWTPNTPVIVDRTMVLESPICILYYVQEF